MAIAKVTDRSELTAQPANDDVVHIVDVSDTTDSANGTSKKLAQTRIRFFTGTLGITAETPQFSIFDGLFQNSR